MTVTEGDRHRLHQALDRTIGTEEATTLMEHLPPVGWADVATKQDLAQLEDRLTTRIDASMQVTAAHFDGLDHRFEAIDHRFDGLGPRFEAIAHRFDGLEHRFEAIDHRFDGLESRFDALGHQLATLDKRMDLFERRLEALEARVEQRFWQTLLFVVAVASLMAAIAGWT